MAYKAVVDFKDLQADHEYKAGDIYPFSGVADECRVKQLMTPTSQRGALIVEVTDKAVDTVEVEEKPVSKRKSKKSEDKKEG